MQLDEISLCVCICAIVVFFRFWSLELQLDEISHNRSLGFTMTLLVACFCIDKMPQGSRATTSTPLNTLDTGVRPKDPPGPHEFSNRRLQKTWASKPLWAPAGCTPLIPKHVLGTHKLPIVIPRIFAGCCMPQGNSLVHTSY